MLDRVGEEIAAEVRTGSPMLARVRTAAERLTNEETARAAAARELVRMGEQDSQGAAERTRRRPHCAALPTKTRSMTDRRVPRLVGEV